MTRIRGNPAGRGRVPWGLALASLLLAITSCGKGAVGEAGDDPSAPAAPPATPAAPPPQEVAADEDFYNIPEGIPPGAPGGLVRFQEIQVPPGVKGWRVLHHSQAVDGRPILVTGLVFAPDGPGEAGARPVVAWGHGSVGLGDKCAPSRVPFSLARQSVVARLVEEGFVVAATDYEGLGTPGPHPWLVGLSEGRTVLDSVRAARQLPESGAGERFLAVGGSQGGGAVLFAGELAPAYAPELKLLGVVAVAPAAELDLLATIPSGPGPIPGSTAFFVMGAFGFAAAYPTLPLDALLPAEVIAERDDIQSLCQDEIDRRFRGVRLDELLKATPAAVPSWAEALRRNTPGRQGTPAPVLLVHGDRDRVVPPQVSELLLQRLCGLGMKAELLIYPGTGHVEVFGASSAEVIEWVVDREAGKELSPQAEQRSCL